ncbi:MAG: hypothetical protein MJ010_03935 [Paludibacteraceae bacterium]|nr:hypothetical protein [Paludibacteraceae bacterium]
MAKFKTPTTVTLKACYANSDFQKSIQLEDITSVEVTGKDANGILLYKYTDYSYIDKDNNRYPAIFIDDKYM